MQVKYLVNTSAMDFQILPIFLRGSVFRNVLVKNLILSSQKIIQTIFIEQKLSFMIQHPNIDIYFHYILSSPINYSLCYNSLISLLAVTQANNRSAHICERDVLKYTLMKFI